MSDLFHDAVPFDFIERVFETMGSCPQHVFQVLTKRSGRLRSLAGRLRWADNIWMGVTVEDRSELIRIEDLARVPARVRFVSCEPLLESLGRLPLDHVDWLIVGGESGPGARPMQREWVESILEQSRLAGIPFFFKQWGGFRKKRLGRELHGRIYEELPENIHFLRRFSAAVNEDEVVI